MPGLIVITAYGHVNGDAAQVAISSLNRLALAGFDVTCVSRTTRARGRIATFHRCRSFVPSLSRVVSKSIVYQYQFERDHPSQARALFRQESWQQCFKVAL